MSPNIGGHAPSNCLTGDRFSLGLTGDTAHSQLAGQYLVWSSFSRLLGKSAGFENVMTTDAIFVEKISLETAKELPCQC